ncbi:hypothetical protein AK830_g9930 [Neonectria ditissima]|uniref:Zn(2)-C6 fungal-type domain-containing protein n=1 Tax=Neonectria ditissima TaxID=78410 RepID=A0A0P7B4P7_9HYPO|nr:hypothetical protein AK830_g9930 [Neonectria ditissima]
MNKNDATTDHAPRNDTLLSGLMNFEYPVSLAQRVEDTQWDDVTAHSSGPSQPPGEEKPQHESRQDVNSSKRFRSSVCKHCRESKVRCEPDPTDAERPCKRCKRSGRDCVAAVLRPRREKKSKSLVAELGKKIDALTASLRAREIVVATRTSLPAEGRCSFATTWQEDGTKTNTRPFATANGTLSIGTAWNAHTIEKQSTHPGMSTVGFEQRRGAASGSDPSRASVYPIPPLLMRTSSEYRDVIDRGVLSIGTATELLERYNKKMLQHLPAVVISPQLFVAELRKTKPLLFLALMAASSAEMPTLQQQLAKELMENLADKVFVRGEKSLEVVQALQLAVIWHWLPEYFEDLDFYRLIYISAVMAIDIGLGQETQGMKTTTYYERRDHTFKQSLATIESRRAWLACYFLAASASMTFHRQNLVKWTPFMADCVRVLESSPDAAPTDKYFCHLVWVYHLAEETLLDFSMEDPSVVLKITDLRAQCFLRVLGRNLETYASPIPQESMQGKSSVVKGCDSVTYNRLATLKISFHVISLRMHEIALNGEGKADMKPPFDTATLEDGMLIEDALTTFHVNAVSACLTAINGIFEAFLSMDLDDIRSLPVLIFSRVAYAIAMLIKICLSAMIPNSELGEVINKDLMKATHYLDELVHKFSDAAADDRCRPVAKYMAVVATLRTWFLDQIKG